ncbi:hypothetical protein ACFQ07_31510, partial [Actinomadura adrarensis]
MSRVYFHSPSGTAELLGAERAHAGIVFRNVALGALGAFHHRERLLELVNPNHDMARHRTDGEMVTWAHWLGTALFTDRGGTATPLLVHRGAPVNGALLLANTAIAAGSDAVRVLTRLDQQCEIHGYVEGPNRAWLADIIDQGLDAGIMRRTLRY